MHTVVALGNPGEEYENTRHNAGRIVLEALLGEKLSPSSKIYRREIGGEAAEILVPDTYMNVSGEAVAQAVGRTAADRLIVIYDDVDLPLGQVRVSFGRGAGGHNGLSSVIASMGTRDFARVRVGVARRNFWGQVTRPAPDKLADFVLSRFSKNEMAVLEKLSGEVGEMLKTIMKDGAAAAMNKFNGRE